MDFATAFPSGGNPDMLPGVNLELAGAVTSPPFTDPNNPNFIYQRFQRVILHYDAASGTTQPILLADYFKAILTGENLPSDLAEQASRSRFFMQYNPDVPLGLNSGRFAGHGYALRLQAPLDGRRTSGRPADTRGPADVAAGCRSGDLC